MNDIDIWLEQKPSHPPILLPFIVDCVPIMQPACHGVELSSQMIVRVKEANFGKLTLGCQCSQPRLN